MDIRELKSIVESYIIELTDLLEKIDVNGRPLDALEKKLLRTALTPHIEQCMDEQQYFMLKGNLRDVQRSHERMMELLEALV